MAEAEWLTRKKRIDTRLREPTPPWQIISYRDDLDLSTLKSHAVEEFPTANGPADYALFVNDRLLGIVEAKKVGMGPQNVLEQAKRYSLGAFGGEGNRNGYRVPFLYATNGETIWHVDMRGEKPVSREISEFHTANALLELFARDLKPAHSWLLDTPTEQVSRLRPYQRNCITAVEAAIRAERSSGVRAERSGVRASERSGVS